MKPTTLLFLLSLGAAQASPAWTQAPLATEPDRGGDGSGQDPARYEAIGLEAEAAGDPERALRAYASLVDLGPRDPDLLARAGYLALRVGLPRRAARYLERAWKERPRHANHARGLALAQRLAGDPQAAAETLATALEQRYPSRYGALRTLLRQEAHQALDAWKAQGEVPASAADALAARIGPRPGPTPELRVSLFWESEADDVDLLERRTPSGLALAADVSQGLGPEVVTGAGLARGRYQVGVRDTRPGGSRLLRALVVIERPGAGEVRVVPLTRLASRDPSRPPVVHRVAEVEVD